MKYWIMNMIPNMNMKYLIHSLDQMEWVKNEKINNLHFHFDGPKSFLED